MILEKSLQADRFGPLSLGQFVIGIDLAGSLQVVDDQAAVGDPRAVLVLDKRELASGRLTRAAQGDRPIVDRGKFQPGFELQGEGADIHAPGRCVLVELDHAAMTIVTPVFSLTSLMAPSSSDLP